MISAVFLAVLLPVALFADPQSDELFHKAFAKESVERNLEGAISLYQQTVGHPRVDPGVAGEARFRMGMCYEKLGQPQDAESVYRQLLSKTVGISPEIVHKAKEHLRQVEAENRLGVVQIPGTPPKVVWVRRFQLSPLSVLLGPTFCSENVYAVSAGLRWRLSSVDRPEHFYIQGRGIVPFSNSTVQEALSPSNLNGTTNASLTLQYQTSLALISELPHGHQRMVIPEVGAGFALTASKISYTNAAFSGDQSVQRWSPYLQAGLQLSADRNLSLLINAAYLPNPYRQSIDVPGPAASTSFGFPSSQWSLTAMLQMKIGYLQSVPEIRK